MSIVLKTPEQIEGIRKSCILARRSLKFIKPFVKPGVTTSFIDSKLQEFIKDHGAKSATLGYRGYPAGSCISVNEVVCHGIPTAYEIKEGDIVNVDISTILDGYFGDTCMMYAMEPISPAARRLLDITRKCLDLGIAECKPGNYLGNIGYAIGNYAKANGFSVVYQFCGHGVGLAFHEDPEVDHAADKDTGPKMKPGMTFTIEPMINEGKARVKVDKKDKWTARTIDNRLSAQYEHTILITENGAEVLTDIDGEYENGKLVKKVEF